MTIGFSTNVWAGNCPSCTSNTDCEGSTGITGAVCVEWDRDFGCGAQRITCCPGQACALTAPGVPSCLGMGCQIYVPAVADAGNNDPDTGAVASDTGATANDSGAGPGDTGGPAADIGAAGDTGTSTSGGNNNRSPNRDVGGATRSGCNCSTSSGPTNDAPWALLVLGLLLARRKR